MPTSQTKHATAGAFLFHHDAELGWRTGLIRHPVFDKWMQPGGHVEPDENPAETALREVAEETGLTKVSLWQPHAPAPTGTSDPIVPLPYWIMEHRLDGDNQLAQPHVHIDYKYVAIITDPTPAHSPEHPFAWWTAAEIPTLSTFDDIKINLEVLFTELPNGIQERRPHGAL